MALWNNKDSENSKPSWLTEEQKRQCFRTIRGWEIPLAGNGYTNTAEDVYGLTSGATAHTVPLLYRAGNFVGLTELLVAMPMDPSSAGATNDNLAGNPNGEKRGQISGWGGTGATNGTYGLTQGGDYNYKPYFTAPAFGITNTAPGTVVYATKGITSYIPVIAADANFTDLPKNFVFTLGTAAASSGLTGLSLTFGPGFTTGYFSALYNTIGATSGTALLSGAALTTRQNLVFNQPTTLVGMTAPAAYWDTNTAASYVVNRYGGWGGITQGVAALRVDPTAVTGNYSLRLSVFDGRASGGLTGTIDFTLTITSGTSF